MMSAPPVSTRAASALARCSAASVVIIYNMIL
jgi:hypothetical protein